VRITHPNAQGIVADGEVGRSKREQVNRRRAQSSTARENRPVPARDRVAELTMRLRKPGSHGRREHDPRVSNAEGSQDTGIEKLVVADARPACECESQKPNAEVGILEPLTRVVSQRMARKEHGE
jgi:hypothetical protein